MNKFKIIKVEDKISIEVLKGNKVIFGKDFEVEDFSLDKARQELKHGVAVMEVKQQEEARLKAKRDELKTLINKKMNL